MATVAKNEGKDYVLYFAQRNLVPLDEYNAFDTELPFKAIDMAVEADGLTTDTPANELCDKLKKYIQRQDDIDSYSMRNAFLLGRTVHLLRAVHHLAWKNVDLAMSRSSLLNYQKFYEFASKYQRFLRVKTTFTGLCKAIPAINAYFKTDESTAAKWVGIDSTEGEGDVEGEGDEGEGDVEGDEGDEPVAMQDEGDGDELSGHMAKSLTVESASLG